MNITSLPKELKVQVLLEKIKNDIVTRITTDISNYATKKHEMSIILLVCTAIENYAIKKHYKVNKMALASEILTTLYSLNTDELAIAIKNIQFSPVHAILPPASLAVWMLEDGIGARLSLQSKK